MKQIIEQIMKLYSYDLLTNVFEKKYAHFFFICEGALVINHYAESLCYLVNQNTWDMQHERNEWLKPWKLLNQRKTVCCSCELLLLLLLLLLIILLLLFLLLLLLSLWQATVRTCLLWLQCFETVLLNQIVRTDFMWLNIKPLDRGRWELKKKVIYLEFWLLY